MNIWSTFRYVPTVSPKALVLAIVSFATFMIATEIPPTFLGRTIDPLALAVAVLLALILTGNFVNPKTAEARAQEPWVVRIAALVATSLVS